ncbi:NADH:flavin oxidoreductase [Aureimonas ureilytica]|uniref:NADH:flavin oxidoreductase n=1 Tax=Aureimonas ureilytica TaxID=401562 RepID=A0A175R3Y0_9HYPH|nr:alkene reductase [Aureimonas ureilytica]KTQ85184.1 NADH:flavin oxidoreductase [Aureimonas ureilytica]
MAPSKIFEPFDLGPLHLSNRTVMAPLTRSRATSDGVPKEMHVEYYRQRAGAGLIISEATNISVEGRGYAWTPGIYSDEQVTAWKKVTDAVHAEGGKIVLQLWHVGRISHPDLQPDGQLPVAPSAVKPSGKAFTEEGFKDHVEPRALEESELPRLIQDYVRATRNARAAGFDGVEVHSANGYLLDQFLRDGTNTRTDRYGGSIENRMRFPLEVVDAVVAAWDKEHVGIRISPVTVMGGSSESDQQGLFNAYVEELDKRGLLYLHVIEGQTGGDRDKDGFDYHALRQRFHGTYMGNNEYDIPLAQQRLEAGEIDLVCFGKLFISNPDLVTRIRLGAPLNDWDKDTFYGGDEHGYTDYPALTPEEQARYGQAA